MAGPIYGEGMVNLRPQLAAGFGTRLASALGPLGTRAGLAFTAAFAIATGVAIRGIRSAIDFDSGIREVFTLLPELTEEARQGIADSVKQLSTDMGVVTGDVLPSLYQAISAGVPVDNVFEFLETATRASIGGVTDLQTAVDGITSVINAYGQENLTANEAADSMFTAVRLGKTTFEELSNALFQVTPIASSLGIEFDEVTAAIAALTQQGVPTSVAATQIRGAMAELVRSGSKASDTFQAITGQTFPAFIEGGGTFREALQLMAREAEETDRPITDMFGRVEAGLGVLALTRDDGQVFLDVMDEMGEKAGAADRAFEEMDAGTQRSLDRIKANLDVLMVNLGEKLLPVFEAVVNWVVVNWPAIERTFKGVWDAFTTATRPVLTLVSGLWGGLTTLWDIAGKLNLRLPILGGIVVVFGTKLALAAWLALGPWGKLLLILVAVVAAVEYMVEHWDRLSSPSNPFTKGGGWRRAIPFGHSGALMQDEGLLVGQRGEFLVDRDTTGRLIEMLNDNIIDRGNGMFDGAAFNFFGSPEQMVADVGRRVGLEVRVA